MEQNDYDDGTRFYEQENNIMDSNPRSSEFSDGPPAHNFQAMMEHTLQDFNKQSKVNKKKKQSKKDQS